mmetsp:Transcript_7373/g.13325  ORF Transcript_7373/g.13325 Transcript_7373/m.13325 type:complete len:340 (-) Transcript_7373:235-1254(-)
MSSQPYDLPLNGLILRRPSAGDGDPAVEGTVIESTISGKPTPQVPFVSSQYLVMWDDGKKEGGLSRAAVLGMSTKRWSSPAWQDLEYESTMPLGLTGTVRATPIASKSSLGPFGFSALSQAFRTSTPEREVSITACIAPPPSSAPAGRRLAGSYAATQDKSRISSLFTRPSPRTEPPRNAVQNDKPPAKTPAKTAQRNAASSRKTGSTAKKSAQRKGKRKAPSDDESDGDGGASEPEEEAVVEEEEVWEDNPLERTYPREVCFHEGDVPLSEYKDNEDPDAEFEVHSIVDEVLIDKKKFVLVKWKGYELDVEDWSPVGAVKHLDLYKEWAKKRKAEGKK